MYNVSEQYKIDINKQIRNPSYIKVKFGIVDPQAKDDSTISDTNSAPYSDSQDIKIENVVSFRYDTLEHNLFFLDSAGHKLANDSYSEFQGYVSDSISSSDCEFSTYPKVIVSYPSPFEFAGITFYFDEIRGEFPSEMLIEYFLNDTKIGEIEAFPTRWDYVIKEPVPLHDEFRITFKKTNLPYRRLKLSYIAFGVVETYSEDRIVSTEQNRKVDVLSTVLPVGDFKFTFLDINNEYNPENPSGFYQYMEQRQPVRFEYGYELDDGSLEWTLGGINYTTGKVNFETNGVIPQVTISTNNTLQYLDSIYSKGVYNPSGRTLYNLVLDLLQDEDVLYDIDSSLSDYLTFSPLPVDTVRNNLQLISNAAMCTLDVDRDGTIVIKRSYELQPLLDNIDSEITDNVDSVLLVQEGNGQTDFKFDKSNSYNVPVVDKLPPLRNLITTNYTYTPKASSEEISKIDISGANNTSYFFDYELATNVSLTVSGLTIVGSPTYYARGCDVVLTGTGTVTITGKKIDVAEVSYIESFNINGADCTITNQLITNSNWSKEYSSWVGNILLLNNEYSIENRGFPEIDPMDKVYTDTFYTYELKTIVTENRISYNGALKGFTKLIIAQ